jgi:carbamate kinase
VHGNGPQVGRLLGAPGIGDPESLDIHVAQTQGELGYLLAEALEARLGDSTCVAVMTRVVVGPADPGFASPTKPIGPVLPAPRAIRSMRVGKARARLAEGAFAPGSMAPKIESAVQYAEATGRPAVIARLGSVTEALAGNAGTRIEP